ncbi:44610_t:CDS:1, partial [Gigaspora margarita]
MTPGVQFFDNDYLLCCVFTFLEKNKDLFNIVLVNRKFTLNGYKFLWRDPFSFDVHNKKKVNKFMGSTRMIFYYGAEENDRKIMRDKLNFSPVGEK